MRLALCASAWVLLLAAAAKPLAGQPSEDLPPGLQLMLETERAFAQRAAETGWKQAFLEYFSDSAIGYGDGDVGFAKDQIRQSPDPPKDQQLLWDPRYGDVARSGELGYLTGPSRNILPSRNNGRPRHGAYASVWKRERDGSFRVVLDVGVNTPQAPPYPATFTRTPHANRFSGDFDDRTPPLGAADSVLNSDLKTSAVHGYRDRLAPGVRFHRPGTMPAVGEAAVLRAMAAQPRFAQIDSRYSESAQSGDLGYTWGTWARPAPPRPAPPRAQPPAQGSAPTAPSSGRESAQGGVPAPPSSGRESARGASPARSMEIGFYARVWVRERTGQWKVVLDVLN
jgi:hypothetical protein